jgi:hypothetical protein
MTPYPSTATAPAPSPAGPAHHARKVIAAALAVPCIALAAPAAFPVAGHAQATDAPSVGETVQALDAAAPEILDAAASAGTPEVTPQDGMIDVVGASVDTEIATDPRDGFSVSAPGQDTLTITPVGVDAAAGPVTPAAGGAVAVATGTDPGVSTVIQPLERGISTYTVISGPQAPERYSWRVEDGQTITVGEDGSATVTSTATGEVIAFVPVPWAKDKTGRELDGVHFETDGQTLTLVVPHRGQAVVYDVVADPIWFAGIAGVVGHAARWAAVACGGGVAASAVYAIVFKGRRALWEDLRTNWQRACVEGIIGRVGLRWLLR